MKTNVRSILGFGLAFTFLCLTLQSPAKKPVKPGDDDPPPVGGLTFELINLGSIPGAQQALVEGINEAGSVVGHFGIDGDAQAFLIEAVDGDYGPVQLIGPADDSFATDINASGMVTTGEMESNEPDRAVLWVDGNPIVLAEGPWARADGINDDGVVVGSIADVYGDGEQAWILEPLDSNSNGEPDTWFVDDDADGINDLIMPLTRGYNDIWERYVAIDIKNDGRALVEFAARYDQYEILPDFSDSDGDYNPWFSDENGDFFNELMVMFEGSVAAANEVGNAVGSVDGVAVIWATYSTTSYEPLGIMSRKDTSGANDINDAQWVVGISSSSKGAKSFLYKDGEMVDFSALCGVEFAFPAVINNSGVVAGNIGPDVFVAIPSEAPQL